MGGPSIGRALRVLVSHLSDILAARVPPPGRLLRW